MPDPTGTNLTDAEVAFLDGRDHGFKRFRLAERIQSLRDDVEGLGYDYKGSCVAATVPGTALPACTYANGVAGVGATLTGNANGALAAQDGVTLTVNQRLLVQSQVAGLQNGIYVLTQVGTAGSPFILTRAEDSDTADELTPFFMVPIEQGTVFGGKWRQCTNTTAIVPGTTAITFGAPTGGFIAGAGADLTISAGGAIIPTNAQHRVIVNGGAGSGADNLDTITATYAVDGTVLFLQGEGTAGDVISIRDVSVGAGNIYTPNGATIEIGVTANDWALLIHDGTNWHVVAHSRSQSSLRAGTAEDALTIAAGAVVPTGVTLASVDTAGAAAEDDLDTITPTYIVPGQCLVLRPATLNQIVCITNAGNIDTPDGEDIRIGYSVDDRVVLMWDGAAWQVLAVAVHTGGTQRIKAHDAFPGSQSVRTTSAGETTDATPLQLWTMTLADDTAYWLEAWVVAREITGAGTSENAYKIACLVHRRAAGAATIGAATVVNHFTDEEDLDWEATFTVVGNDVQLTVTGDAATTSLAWAATISYQGVGALA